MTARGDVRGRALAATAAHVVRLSLGRVPTLGEGRLVCVDGRAGAGKTTLAAAVARAAGPGARVVHMDDLYAGWTGLPSAAASAAEQVLRPLAEGRAAAYRRYDWHTSRYAEDVPVPPGPLLVLEGVGSWAPSHADLVTTLVWVEAPRDLRVARGLERDGAGMRHHWETWMAAEDAWFSRTSSRGHADVVVDGVTGEVLVGGRPA